MAYAALKRKVHPRENANLLSKATFFYTIKDFINGFRKDLSEDDLYEAVSCCTATSLADRAEKEWKLESQKEKPSIVRMMLRMFGKEYALMGLANLVLKTVLLVLRPILLGKLLNFFKPDTEMTKEEAYFYGSALVGASLLSSVYLHGYMFLISQLGLKLRISFCSLIYRKSLKLSPESLNKISNGKIVTLIAKDVFAFDSAIMFVHDMWIGIIQIFVMTYVMYLQISWTAFVGVAFLISLIPLQVYLGKVIQKRRLESNMKTDERVRLIQEILVSMKTIKMYVWEKFFDQKASQQRSEEMKKIRAIFFIKTIIFSTGALATRLSFYLCMLIYMTYYSALTAEQAFIVVGSYAALRSVITISIPIGLAQVAEAKTAFKRIKSVLLAEELQKVKESPSDVKPEINLDNCKVEIGEHPVLAIEKINVKSGFVGLTGPVGSGKSTLLKLILRDTILVNGTVTVNGTLSYASQEPWLFPGTIRQNIIFGEKIDEARYQKVVQMCALTSDLEGFPLQDRTVIMDKGSNLSKGQQARVNLARCIYRNADIYLLDDCLASLDANVSRYIFNTAIRQFLSDKIVIFVSHQKSFLKQADRVVVLEGGKVVKDLTSSEIDNLKLEVIELDDFQEKAIDNDDDDEMCCVKEKEDASLLGNKSSGVYKEVNKQGSVDFKVYKKYFSAGGGLMIISTIAFVFILTQISSSWFDLFISKWVDSQQSMSLFEQSNQTQNETYLDLKSAHEDSLMYYSILITLATVFTVGQSFLLFYFTAKASENLHKKCFASVIKATMSFFDYHLAGNIVNRFSRDIGILDELMPFVVFECFRVSFLLVGVLFLIISTNVSFSIAAAVMLIILYLMKVVYLPSGRSLKRLENATRSPVVGHINSSLEGLSTVRGSRAESILTIQFDKYQDVNSSSSYMYITQSRAFGFFMDILSGLFIAVIVMTFIIWDNSAMAGKVGLAITQAFGLTGLLQWGIRNWAELENCMTSVERISEYGKAEKEENHVDNNVKNWPNNGKVKFENVSMKYNKSIKPVLKQITFEMKPGEKIGIIGRTGAGKSSIISAIFKLYETKGSIYIDDLNTKVISPDVLRKKLSIIPQDPLLFVGTIRENLDPFKEYDDNQIWNALETVEMKQVVTSLDYLIKEGGINFSAGQKQLICMARAILRNNTILILDEATANVDPVTDDLIQRIIKKKFSHCTTFIVAHKLENVMDCDKIMVLNKGSILELDSPSELLKNKDGVFTSMARQSGLVSSNTTKDKDS